MLGQREKESEEGLALMTSYYEEDLGCPDERCCCCCCCSSVAAGGWDEIPDEAR